MPTEQGFAAHARERLRMPTTDAMNDAQRAAAQALIDGPRKGVYGPFLPLLRSPDLLERVAKVGEFLRFGSTIDARVRELVTCATARHEGNQFEWMMHAPLAVQAGVSPDAVESSFAVVAARPPEPSGRARNSKLHRRGRWRYHRSNAPAPGGLAKRSTRLLGGRRTPSRRRSAPDLRGNRFGECARARARGLPPAAQETVR